MMRGRLAQPSQRTIADVAEALDLDYWQSWINDDEPPLCRAQPELFFSIEGETYSEGKARSKAAQRLCADCPIQLDCLDHAMEARELGILGGTTDIDRDNLREEQAKANRRKRA